MYGSFITLEFTGLSVLWGNVAGRNVRIRMIYIKIRMQQKAKKEKAMAMGAEANRRHVI